MRGLVMRGSWNIFIVRPDHKEKKEEKEKKGKTEVACRLKGKVLKGLRGYYNPLAPGDRVIFEPDPQDPARGVILDLEARRNALTRLNQKALGRERSAGAQVIAANVDLLLCVTTAASPPFRPRFLDRLIIQGERARIPPLIVCNKQDIALEDPDVEERLSDFRRIGYPVLPVSARTGAGMDELRRALAGRFSVLAGQSGVGKSSLVKALIPDTDIRVGALNEKYDRGSHTTTLAAALELPAGAGGGFIIDTPGIRRFVPEGIASGEVLLYMREFAGLLGKCAYGISCSHRTEAGCKIMEAVAAGVIHPDRYESFLRIQQELHPLRGFS
jgi:ribosome biogenesis GTPase